MSDDRTQNYSGYWLSLSNEEAEAIIKAEVRFEDVLDASFEKTKYKRNMLAGGYLVAIGGHPCWRGHRIRDRNSHCLVCQPLSMTYFKRHYSSASVYVAHSEYSGLIKVGLATDVKTRLYGLNNILYAGQDDWKLVVSCQAANAGKIEAELHRRLSSFRSKEEYFKDGGWINGKEIFECSIETAIEQFESLISATKNKSSEPQIGHIELLQEIISDIYDNNRFERISDMVKQISGSGKSIEKLTLECLSSLSDEDSIILTTYYGIGQARVTSWSDLAGRLRLSKPTVKKRFNHAIRRLRHPCRIDRLCVLLQRICQEP
jgi:hypothetical protein